MAGLAINVEHFDSAVMVLVMYVCMYVCMCECTRVGQKLALAPRPLMIYCASPFD
jgi:hypothetical protein